MFIMNLSRAFGCDKRMFSWAPVADVRELLKYFYFRRISGFQELNNVYIQTFSRGPDGQSDSPGGLPDTGAVVDVDQSEAFIPDLF